MARATERQLAEPARTTRGSGPGLMLAHGAGGNVAGNFGPIMNELAARWRVVGLDMPGSGDTPVSRVALSLDAVSEQFLAAADAEGIDRFAIAGWSLGAAVAVRVASRAPERVTALVLTSPFAVPDARLSLAAELWRDLYATGDPRLVLRFLMVVARGTRSLEAMTPQQREAALSMAPRIVVAGTPHQADLVREVDIRDDLHRITAPTLIISTTGDRLVAPALHRQVADGIPGATVAHLDTGHLAFAEEPRGWLNLTSTFLETHGRE